MTVTRAPGTPLTFEFVPSARIKPLYTVADSDPLSRAISMMELHNFSQLPVTKGNGTRATGVVTWESIGRALAHNPRATLRECMLTEFTIARISDDLLEKIPSVYREGFVIVLGDGGEVTGLVTSADLAEQFANIAGPHLLLEKIESGLRGIVTHLEMQNLLDPVAKAACLPSVTPTDRRASNEHPLGDMVSIVTHETVWRLLRTSYDRQVLAGALNRAVELRNRIVHFRELTSEDVHVRDGLRELSTIVASIVRQVSPTSPQIDGTAQEPRAKSS
jgi:CBS domain-containing protein